MNVLKRYSLLHKTKYCQMRILKRFTIGGIVVLMVAATTVLLTQPTNLELKLALAKRQVAELESILNGKLQMVDREGRYARVATVKWEAVELVK